MCWLRGIAIILMSFGIIMALVSIGTDVTFKASVLILVGGVILEIICLITTRERK